MRGRPQRERQIIFMIGLLTLLALGQVIAANRLVVLDSRLEKVRSDVLTTKQNNELLQQKIASASALATIRQRAEEANLTSKLKVLSVPQEYPIAKAH